MSLDVVGIGSPFVDYFFDADNAFLKKYKLKPEDDVFFKDKNLTLQKVEGMLPLLAKSPGGISVNTISVLTTLGAKTSYIGTIGNDEDGKFFKKNIKLSDYSMMTIKGKTPVCACVLNTERKHRLFLSTINNSDNDYLKTLDYKKLNNTRIIHVSPFFKNPDVMIKKWGKILEKTNQPLISFTPSILWVVKGISYISPILKKTHVLFLNGDELKALTKTNPGLGSKKLLQYGPKIIVVTLGEKGVLITTAKEQILVEAQKVKKITDSTGAGDAFAAGFLYGILQNKSLKWSAEFGNKMGAKALSAFGLTWSF